MEKIISNNQNHQNNKKSSKDYLVQFKNHVLNLYKSKYIIWKLVIFLIVSLIVFTTSFLIRDEMLKSTQQSYSFIPGFLDVNIVGNTGIAFSNLSNASSSLVYFIQSLPIIISFIFLLFTKSIPIDIGLSFILTGGMSNVIDRSIFDNYAHLSIVAENAVVDYWYFPFIKNSSIFNFPDVCVIFGVIIVALTLIIQFIKDLINDSDAKKNKKDNSLPPPMSDKEIQKIKEQNQKKIKMIGLNNQNTNGNK